MSIARPTVYIATVGDLPDASAYAGYCAEVQTPASAYFSNGVAWVQTSTGGAANVIAPYLRGYTYTDGTYNYYVDAPYGSLLTQAVWHVNRYQIASPNESVDALNVLGDSVSVLAMGDTDFNGGSIS